MDEWSLIILTILVLLLPSFRHVFFRKVEKKEETKVSERIIFFDILKGLAILAVILIHATFFFDHTNNLANNEIFLNIINNLSRFAIPFFFICSGILLNPIKNKKELKAFYSRKLVRIILPYFLVTMYLFFANPVSFKTLLYQLITGSASIPFYFVLVLLQLYLLYPLLSRWRYNRWFLPISFLVSLSYFISPLPQQPFGFPIFLPFLFLFSYGVYSRDHFLNYQPNKQDLFMWLMITLVYLLIMVWGQDYYYNQRFFYGPALFNILFFFSPWIIRRRWLSKFLLAFGQNSLWIFLVHFSLMWVMYPYFYRLHFNYYVTFAAFFFISVGTSYLIGLVCQLLYDAGVSKLTVSKIKN